MPKKKTRFVVCKNFFREIKSSLFSIKKNHLFVYNLMQVFEEIDASKSMELGGKNENASSAFDAMVGTVYV